MQSAPRGVTEAVKLRLMWARGAGCFLLGFFPRDKRTRVVWGGGCPPGRRMYSTDETLYLCIMALLRFSLIQ